MTDGDPEITNPDPSSARKRRVITITNLLSTGERNETTKTTNQRRLSGRLPAGDEEELRGLDVSNGNGVITTGKVISLHCVHPSVGC